MKSETLFNPITALPTQALFIQRLKTALDVPITSLNKGIGIVVLRIKGLHTWLGSDTPPSLRHLFNAIEKSVHHIQDQSFVAHLNHHDIGLLFMGESSEKSLIKTIKRVIRRIKQLSQLQNAPFDLQLFAGSSYSDNQGRTPQNLLMDAQIACETALRDKSSSYLSYTPQMSQEHILQAYNTEEIVKKIIDQGGLDIHYLPIVHIQTQKIVGIEALLRWNFSEEEMRDISPKNSKIPSFAFSDFNFLETLKNTGLIQQAERWLIKKSCSDLNQLHCMGHKSLRLHINLSTQQLTNPSFLQFINDQLTVYDITPNLIALEFNEAEVNQIPEEVCQPMFKQISQRGIHIALDDFGVGATSSQFLQDVPIHSLKIDRCFIANYEKHRALFKAIFNIAHSKKLDVIAEGITHEKQATFLKDYGCKYAQGRHYSMPMAFHHFIELITNKKGETPASMSRTDESRTDSFASLAEKIVPSRMTPKLVS